MLFCHEQKVRPHAQGLSYHKTVVWQTPGVWRRHNLLQTMLSLSRSVSRILSSVVIYLGRELPLASGSLPGGCPLWEGNGSFPDPVDLPSCLALLPAGVAWPPRLPGAPVVSYTTFSPLPGLATCGGLFLWPCPRVASPGYYPALHPLESGLSSPRPRIAPRSATTGPTQAQLQIYYDLPFRQWAASVHRMISGGARKRARGAPSPSMPNPRLT